jgi:uncharacterized protein
MPNYLHSAISRRIGRANRHLETIIEMIKQGHSRKEISQQIQAVESATENAKKALIPDHSSLGLEQSVKSTDDIQGRQADREIMDEDLIEPEVLAVARSDEEEDRRIFMRFAKDLGFDLDAINFHFKPEKSGRNGPSEGVSRVCSSPLRVGEASRVILIAVGSRVILVAILGAVFWTMIRLVS